MDRPKRAACKKLFDDLDGEASSVDKKKASNLRYRVKILSDSVMAAAFKAKERERLRQYRASLSDEKKEQQKLKRRIREEKKKRDGVSKKKKPAPKPATRATQQVVEQRRENNRLAQQKRRANMSSQKKRREKEKNRAYYHSKKEKAKAAAVPVTSDAHTVPTSSARSSALHRLRKKLGSGKKLLINLQQLIRQLHKRQASELDALGIKYSSPTKLKPTASLDLFTKMFEVLKPMRSKIALKAKSLITDIAGSLMDKYSIRKHGLHRTRATEPYRRLYKSATDKAITEYFEDNSVYLSSKNAVDKDLVSRKILDRTIVSLFNDFVAEHGTIVCRATFFKKRPKNVLSFLKTPYKQCMCDICINPMIKMRVLGKLCGCSVDSVKELVKMTVCEELKRVCLMRRCNDCGSDGLDGVLNKARMVCDRELEWKRWEYVMRRGKSRLELVNKRGSFDEFGDELKCESRNLALHDYVHRWQSHQYRLLCKSLPSGWAVLTLDFAENYLCCNQDQPQSAYYGYSQVTVHPCVLYYNCQCGERVTSNVVFLSDDLCHSANMVDAIVRKLFSTHLPPHIHHMVIFSDGCSSQYKSKLPFFFFFHLSRESLLTVERCYFGSRHGKNPCDALGGVVKRAASRAVLARTVVIQNASDMLDFCRRNLSISSTLDSECSHLFRCFEMVQSEDLPVISSCSLQTVPGTRAIHSVRPVKDGLLARNLSCFCPACVSGCYNACPHIEFVGSWRPMKFTNMWLSLRPGSAPLDNSVNFHADSAPVNDNVVCVPVDDNVVSAPVDDNVFCVPVDDNVVSVPVDDNAVSAPVDDNAVSAPVDDNVVSVPVDDNVVSAPVDDNVVSVPVDDKAVDLLPISINEPLLVEESREQFFHRFSLQMSNCQSYNNLVACVDSFSGLISQFALPSQLAYPSILDCQGSVDKAALALVPKGLTCLYPLMVGADGNCVPRSISVWAFGSEDCHLEVRCRIVSELVLNSTVYLTLPSEELATLSLLSDFHCEDLYMTYQAEVLDVSRPSSFMGMWQLMAACNAFGSPIMSVYPTLGPASISSFFNRTLQPAVPRHKDCIALLWCSSRDMRDEHWVANHVAPLLHLTTPCAIEFQSI